MNFNLWIESLTKPVSTFKKERKRANLSEGALHIAVAGIVTGFIMGLIKMVFGSAVVGQYFPMASGLVGAAAFLATLILTPIVSVISWLIMSGILYIFALIFGGKGDYKTQSYLYAIYNAPLSIITTILILIPIIGPFLAFIIVIYGLYLLTMALKETHRYTTGRAVLTWLAPVLIIIIFAVIVGVAVLSFLMGSFVGSIPSGF